jgi:hypothetical protein
MTTTVSGQSLLLGILIPPARESDGVILICGLFHLTFLVSVPVMYSFCFWVSVFMFQVHSAFVDHTTLIYVRGGGLAMKTNKLTTENIFMTNAVSVETYYLYKERKFYKLEPEEDFHYYDTNYARDLEIARLLSFGNIDVKVGAEGSSCKFNFKLISPIEKKHDLIIQGSGHDERELLHYIFNDDEILDGINQIFLRPQRHYGFNFTSSVGGVGVSGFFNQGHMMCTTWTIDAARSLMHIGPSGYLSQMNHFYGLGFLISSSSEDSVRLRWLIFRFVQSKKDLSVMWVAIPDDSSCGNFSVEYEITLREKSKQSNKSFQMLPQLLMDLVVGVVDRSKLKSAWLIFPPFDSVKDETEEDLNDVYFQMLYARVATSLSLMEPPFAVNRLVFEKLLPSFDQISSFREKSQLKSPTLDQRCALLSAILLRNMRSSDISVRGLPSLSKWFEQARDIGGKLVLDIGKILNKSPRGQGIRKQDLSADDWKGALVVEKIEDLANAPRHVLFLWRDLYIESKGSNLHVDRLQGKVVRLDDLTEVISSIRENNMPVSSITIALKLPILGDDHFRAVFGHRHWTEVITRLGELIDIFNTHLGSVFLERSDGRVQHVELTGGTVRPCRDFLLAIMLQLAKNNCSKIRLKIVL